MLWISIETQNTHIALRFDFLLFICLLFFFSEKQSRQPHSVSKSHKTFREEIRSGILETTTTTKNVLSLILLHNCLDKFPQYAIHMLTVDHKCIICRAMASKWRANGEQRHICAALSMWNAINSAFYAPNLLYDLDINFSRIFE